MAIQYATDKTTDFIQMDLYEKINKKKMNVNIIDPIKLEWRNQAIEKLHRLITEIDVYLAQGTNDADKISAGVSIKKVLPKLSVMTFLDYTEVKYLCEKAWYAWQYIHKPSFKSLSDKCKQIHLQKRGLIEAGGTYNG